MKDSFQIQYLTNKEIDRARWDSCIRNADNSLIYARSFCLDSICNWDALVLRDYEAVMPLPFKTKMGIRYVYQVPFFQQLGVFGKSLSPDATEAFYTAASKHFKFIHYNVNLNTEALTFKSIPLTNYIIPLQGNYDSLQTRYSSECKKNIRKARERGCIINADVTVEEIINIYKAAYGKLHTSISDKDYEAFETMLQNALQQNLAEVYSVTDENNETIYAAALLKDEKRLYYVMGAPTEAGRQKRAGYFFIDSIIEKYAGTNLIFDFEGSDIPNVADFYKKFNPEVETYYEVKYNNLPFPLNLFK